MGKVAVVFWSGTGNTEKMADFIAAGAKESGAEVTTYTAADFKADMIGNFDAIAFGCPSMGEEVLEEAEFEPMFTSVLPSLKGKKIALFGSYGWGDGEWMRTWQEDVKASDISLIADGLIAHEDPDADAENACKKLGASLA